MKNIQLRLKPPLQFTVSKTVVIRCLVVLTVALALAAGYYQLDADNQFKRYKRLEDSYVRVRSQLGPEETQKLIDESYTNPSNQ